MSWNGAGSATVPSDPWLAGVTLVELLVVLALLGVMLGVTTVAIVSLDPPVGAERAAALRRARAEAVRTGKPVRITGSSMTPGSDRSPLPVQVLFLPDGSARGPGIDPLTGRPHATP